MIKEVLESSEVNWKKVQLKRGNFLLRAGEKERYMGFVISGALRAFRETDEEEHTIRFAYKNSIIAALPAYFTNLPSDMSIQAIRKTTVLQANKIEFINYWHQSLERLKMYNSLLQELIVSYHEREVDLLTQSSKERIDRIQKRSPQVFQEVPHRYIASYLRMSPETLSRLLKS